MRTLLIGCLLVAACTSQPTASTPPTAARGLSCDSAVEVNGSDGAKRYVAENYPGSTWVAETRTTCNGVAAQNVEVKTANGETIHLFFIVK